MFRSLTLNDSIAFADHARFDLPQRLEPFIR
jgi:hypothetical protein